MSADPQVDETVETLPPGRVVGGRYEVQSVLGEGATGMVYLAKRPGDGGRVALKVIHRNLVNSKQTTGRFRREVEILKRLDGQHVVKLLDFVEDDGLLVIALEYVEGTSLDALLAETPRLDAAQAIEIMLQICAALGSAHAAGIVHRDLKPANVLIEKTTAERPGLRVRVVDFGLAKVVQGEQNISGLTEHGMIFGTAEYMAPEQVRGDEVDPRSDLYSAGIILYQMVAGSVPFRSKSPIATMTAHITEAPPSPRSSKPDAAISTALETVILRALAKNPDERYPSARAMAEAVAAARNARLVIAPHQVGDAVAIAISDTDLSVSQTNLAHSPTAPEMKLSKSQRLALAKTMPAVIEKLSSIPPAKAPPGRWFWAIVAIVAGLIGVGIGVLIGSR